MHSSDLKVSVSLIYFLNLWCNIFFNCFVVFFIWVKMWKISWIFILGGKVFFIAWLICIIRTITCLCWLSSYGILINNLFLNAAVSAIFACEQREVVCLSDSFLFLSNFAMFFSLIRVISSYSTLTSFSIFSWIFLFFNKFFQRDRLITNDFKATI